MGFAVGAFTSSCSCRWTLPALDPCVHYRRLRLRIGCQPKERLFSMQVMFAAVSNAATSGESTGLHTR